MRGGFSNPFLSPLRRLGRLIFLGPRPQYVALPASRGWVSEEAISWCAVPVEDSWEAHGSTTWLALPSGGWKVREER
jgi:hypothetical protein